MGSYTIQRAKQADILSKLTELLNFIFKIFSLVEHYIKKWSLSSITLLFAIHEKTIKHRILFTFLNISPSTFILPNSHQQWSKSTRGSGQTYLVSKLNASEHYHSFFLFKMPNVMCDYISMLSTIINEQRELRSASPTPRPYYFYIV